MVQFGLNAGNQVGPGKFSDLTSGIRLLKEYEGSGGGEGGGITFSLTFFADFVWTERFLVCCLGLSD